MMRSKVSGLTICELPSSASSGEKIRFYLKHGLNPEILLVTEPANRYYPYLLAVPSDRKDRFDLS